MRRAYCFENRGDEACGDCRHTAKHQSHPIECLEHWREKHGDGEPHRHLITDRTAYFNVLGKANVPCEFCPEDAPLHLNQKLLAVHQLRDHDQDLEMADNPPRNDKPQSKKRDDLITRGHCCSLCDGDFSQTELPVHMREQHPERTYACKFCDEIMIDDNRNTHLKEHMKRLLDKRPTDGRFQIEIPDNPYTMMAKHYAAKYPVSQSLMGLNDTWKFFTTKTDAEKEETLTAEIRRRKARAVYSELEAANVTDEEADIQAEIDNIPQDPDMIQNFRAHWKAFTVEQLEAGASLTSTCGCDVPNPPTTFQTWISHIQACHAYSPVKCKCGRVYAESGLTIHREMGCALQHKRDILVQHQNRFGRLWYQHLNMHCPCDKSPSKLAKQYNHVKAEHPDAEWVCPVCRNTVKASGYDDHVQQCQTIAAAIPDIPGATPIPVWINKQSGRAYDLFDQTRPNPTQFGWQKVILICCGKAFASDTILGNHKPVHGFFFNYVA
ncbi:hypothetical protein LX36DRAFT_325690 [Colletotrichum falcatum]|nr:hypothetical protein LX36DRAFT_325690 [Colletotrichum falcatum]